MVVEGYRGGWESETLIGRGVWEVELLRSHASRTRTTHLETGVALCGSGFLQRELRVLGISESLLFGQQLGEAVAVAATQGQLFAVVEDDYVFSGEPGLEFADAAAVDDSRAMDADEVRALKFGFADG